MEIVVTTSKANEAVITSNNYYEIADFIKKNRDARFRTLDHTGYTKILNRKIFLNNLKKQTEDLPLYFTLTEILIKDISNRRDYLIDVGLREEYKKYKETI